MVCVLVFCVLLANRSRLVGNQKWEISVLRAKLENLEQERQNSLQTNHAGMSLSRSRWE